MAFHVRPLGQTQAVIDVSRQNFRFRAAFGA